MKPSRTWRSGVGRVALTLGLVLSTAACGSRTPLVDIVAAEGGRPAMSATQSPIAVVDNGSFPTTTTASSARVRTAATAGHAISSAPHPRPNPSGVPPTAQKAVPGITPSNAVATCSRPLSPIRIGQVGGWTGLIGSVLAPTRLALQVWAKHVNSAGGVACHPIQIFQADDSSDPSRSAAAVQDLVDNKKVVAIVGSEVPISIAGFAAKVNQEKVPAIGGDMLSYEWTDTPYMFPEGGDLTGAILGAVQEQVERGHKKFGLITCVEAKPCTDALAVVDRELHRTGATEVYRTQVSVTAPDFSAQCQAAKNAGADNLLIGLDSSGLSRFMRSCKALNYLPALGGAHIAITDGLAQDKNVTAATFAIGESVAPWTEQLTPAQTEYHRAFEQLAPGASLNGSTSVGWVSAELFAKAITNLGADAAADITPELVMRGLHTIKTETLGGLTVPLTFRPGAPSAGRVPCYFGVLLTDQGWQAPEGNKYRCFT